MSVIKDSLGNDLEVGAMYCCVDVEFDHNNQEVENLHVLVRYVGVIHGRHTFADADTWEENNGYFDELVRQATPIIDPTTKGW